MLHVVIGDIFPLIDFLKSLKANNNSDGIVKVLLRRMKVPVETIHYKTELLSLCINEHLLYFSNSQVITLLTLETSLLKIVPSESSILYIHTLTEFILTIDRGLHRSIIELTQQSKQILQ